MRSLFLTTNMQAGFMNWLGKKLKVKVPFDENKLYASEILSILLQTEPGNRKMFGELNAIDNLLQQVSQITVS